MTTKQSRPDDRVPVPAPSLTLLLASDRANGGADDRYPLDPIRMQKAVFLLVQRGPEKWHNSYAYRPYNWGPYSSSVNAELKELTQGGLLEEEDVPGHRHSAYKLTPTGEATASILWEKLAPEEQAFVMAVRKYVTSRSFSDLLREVYAQYPEFASRSLFNRT